MRNRTALVALLAGLLATGGGAPAVAAPSAAGFDLERARIPATCAHPAARLHDGVKRFGTRPDGSSRGDASLVPRPYSPAVPIRHPIHARQRGSSSHGAAVVAPICCSAGGVDHPQTLVLYNRTGKILASTDLGVIARQEHASVTSIRLDGDRVTAHWDAYEGAGYDVHHQAATFTLRHGRLVASSISRG